MGNTRAEIQKVYRERKEFNYPSFLENERKRARGNRVPAQLLHNKELIARREKKPKSIVKHTARKKKVRKRE
jgi:hypothetical protein